MKKQQKRKGKINDGENPKGNPEEKKNYNSKKEDLEEKDQRQDERNVIL